MEYEFDPAKNAQNIAKHGLPLSDVALIDWDNAVIFPDTRHDYGEVRMVGFGYIDSRLHCAVFVDRENVRRVISLRKANPREEKRYATT